MMMHFINLRARLKTEDGNHNKDKRKITQLDQGSLGGEGLVNLKRQPDQAEQVKLGIIKI